MSTANKINGSVQDKTWICSLMLTGIRSTSSHDVTSPLDLLLMTVSDFLCLDGLQSPYEKRA